MKRHRQRNRDVTGGVTVTGPDTESDTDKKSKKAKPVTSLIEVTDEDALAAWDAYGSETRGKSYPRNRRGGWCFPTKWPPTHKV
jgi:hypothetical protein